MPVPRADETLIFHPPPATRTSSSNATDSSWGPYAGAGDFGANMAIVLAALFCTILLALSLGAVVRFLLSRRHHREGEPCEEPKKPRPWPPSVPAVLYSAAGTRMAGGETECAICLTEFAEGDAVRVLPACNHGFHVGCIERWLAARSSCPTCRARCGVEAGQGEQGRVEVVVQGI
ncbi:RING-H2 finger protein ATL79-like [Canna indica]|uniref:RING-H2 finger protein ATL79-like n=1 Tax=Canna indica TaxID=4628 RepID=A0AAQ3JV73_9LILI|nr:RING-H2 finger protein ATL79-like [Canna indica]